MPEWFGEKPAIERPGPEQIREAEELAREMRLYALRMPLMVEPGGHVTDFAGRAMLLGGET